MNSNYLFDWSQTAKSVIHTTKKCLLSHDCLTKQMKYDKYKWVYISS